MAIANFQSLLTGLGGYLHGSNTSSYEHGCILPESRYPCAR